MIAPVRRMTGVGLKFIYHHCEEERRSNLLDRKQHVPAEEDYLDRFYLSIYFLSECSAIASSSCIYGSAAPHNGVGFIFSGYSLK